jgi:hypothetical protein
MGILSTFIEFILIGNDALIPSQSPFLWAAYGTNSSQFMKKIFLQPLSIYFHPNFKDNAKMVINWIFL